MRLGRGLIALALIVSACGGVEPSRELRPTVIPTVDIFAGQVKEIGHEYELVREYSKCLNPLLDDVTLNEYITRLRQQVEEQGRQVLDKEVRDAKKAVEDQGINCEIK